MITTTEPLAVPQPPVRRWRPLTTRRPPTRRMLLVNGALAVVLVAALVLAWTTLSSAPAPSAVVRTTPVRQGALTASVTGTGNVGSPEAAAVNFTTGGVLTALDVKPGDVVRAGQTLAQVDPTAARQAVTNALAQLSSAQAAYSQAVSGASATQRQKDQLAVSGARLSVAAASTAVTNAQSQLSTDTTTQNAAVATAQAAVKAGTGTLAQVTAADQTRTATLAKDTQAVTSARQQLAQANNQLSVAEVTVQGDSTTSPAQAAQAAAGVTTARTALQQAQRALAQTTLTAPSAGTVLAVNAAVGQTVSGGAVTPITSGTGASSGTGSGGGSGSSAASSAAAASGFIVLENLRDLTVTANIAEADAIKVKPGQAAVVTLLASGTTVDGTVTAVGLQSITSNNVIQYPVTVTLSDPPSSVKLGASASVAITTATVDNGLYVPSSTVTTRGGASFVTVLRGATQQVVPVTTGIAGDSGTQILSGLAAGDQVVLPTVTTSGGPTGGAGRFGGFGGIGGRG